VTGTQDVVTIDGASGGVDVEISGFTIKGLAPTGECAPIGTTYLLSGVFVRGGANANIHDNVITGLRGDPLDGCQKGIGIRVGRAASTTAGTATITSNTISDNQKGGIVVDGPGSSATITGNTITGVGPTNVIAQNGIQVSRGAAATVTGNRVSGNQYTGTGAFSTGLLLFASLGKVTVSGNTFTANDVGISVAQVLPPPGEATAVRANRVSGGRFGISVSGPTTAVLIEQNTITGASDTGIDVGIEAAGNLLRGNEASGADPNAAGEFDCHDRSLGNRSSGTANIWEDNTGAVALPDGICSPKSAPPETPVEVEPPQVIVLPPSQPGAPVQPPQPAGPVAEAKADEVIAKMRDKQLSSCAIELRTRGQQKLVVARGLARAPAGGRGQMVIKLNVQPKGEQLLERNFGGVLVDVRALCRTASGATVNGVKGARAVLAIERVVTTPGSWLPDLAVLTPLGQRFVAGLARKMVAIEGIRCDGYTATWPPSPVDPMVLSRERAQLVCAQLKRAGGFKATPRIVPHGKANPIASNDTETGRAANRRAVITFVHRVGVRTSNARV
jgi:parallel beta-helix repeat protein